QGSGAAARMSALSDRVRAVAGLTLLHAADLHLGSPFKGLAAQGELARVFADCTFDAFTRLVDLAIAQQVDGVLLAGDLYDQKDRSLRARLHLKQQLQRLDAASIPSFLVHGNHDPLDGDPGGLALPPSVKVFGAGWEEVELPGYCVQGISFPTPEVKQNLSAAFGRRGPKPTIGLLHCNVGGQAGHSDYAPCTLQDLERAGLDYWALGHVHTRAQYPLAGNALAAYPGNLQGRHVNEPGERGALLVTLDPARELAPTTRFVCLDTVRWHRLELAIDEVDSIDALIELGLTAIARAAGAVPSVVRLQLTGRGPLHPQLQSAERLLELELAVRARLPEQVLLESLRDLTAPGWELERLIASGGLVCEVALQLRQRPAPAQLESLWACAGLDALDAALIEAGLAPLKPQAPALLHQAATRAVDLLEGDSSP
ncbi:MAG: double-strand break repair protein Mre11, partial [Myxococcaceae bacterium]|nr:double-strand break repair protein Mre11 [Myxococcaceae bacterium]